MNRLSHMGFMVMSHSFSRFLHIFSHSLAHLSLLGLAIAAQCGQVRPQLFVQGWAHGLEYALGARRPQRAAGQGALARGLALGLHTTECGES